MFKDDYKETFSKVTASGDTYRRVMNMTKQQKKTRTVHGTIGKVLIAAAILSTLVVTASAAEFGWFRQYFEEKNEAPLTQAEAEFIEKNEQPINETMARTQTEPSEGAARTQDGYTLRVKSALTDGWTAFITIGVTGPEDAVLTKTEIPGYAPEAPYIMAGNCFEPGFFERAEGEARLGVFSYESLEDNDGRDNTHEILLKVSAETEDGTQPFAPGTVWKLHIEDLVAQYHDLEAQKKLDEQYGGGEYISFTEVDGIDPYPVLTLAEGSWDYEIDFAGSDTGTIEFIQEPVMVRAFVGRTINDEGFENVNITSFTLSSFGAVICTDVTGGVTEFSRISDGGYGRLYAVMQDGSQTELSPRSGSQGKEWLDTERPIVLDNVVYVLLADGTKLPRP